MVKVGGDGWWRWLVVMVMISGLSWWRMVMVCGDGDYCSDGLVEMEMVCGDGLWRWFVVMICGDDLW